ncbi:MAG: outer membrane lipoprotein-sorting protein [Methylococcales bacterium]|nr:outer membrane lipoprotein-sorting protein [Methylococcales bacterium]
MKKFLSFNSIIFILFYININVSANQTEIKTPVLTGKQILDEVSNRHDRPYEFEIQQMTLIDNSGNEEKREMHRYKRELDVNESRYVSVFLAPSGIKGVSLLTWQHKNTMDDQWLFLPAYGKKMKRISKGGRKNYFMGTDYTFEDLNAEERDKFSYERLADETLNGIQNFVIKAVAIETSLIKETGYSFRKLWISQDNFLVLRIDFYDKRERLIKRQLNSEVVHIKEKLWRANKSVMEHFIHQHKTITLIEKRTFEETSVPEKIFRERSVINGSLIR